jgi:tetrahydromethanopterin S-methyltransferase subunit F
VLCPLWMGLAIGMLFLIVWLIFMTLESMK